MTLSLLPLSYCTNVHPGRSLAEVDEGLDRYTVPIQANYGSQLAAGLWLAAPVIRELERSSDEMKRFAERLAGRGLTCFTLNAFPYGDFHSTRVKENVYLPDWTQLDRLAYTTGCARCLAALLPAGTEGSISTVPLGFKPFQHTRDFADRCIDQLIALAGELDRLYERTGRLIRLAIEPEPFCEIETTEETIQFFARLRSRAADEALLHHVETHLGVCYDICHQAVEFEDVAASVRSLVDANIRINKVHISCAIEVSEPGRNPEALKALSRYVEPRYLHQTFAKSRSGRISRYVDLDENMTSSPMSEFRDAEMWRVHFHVPVDAEHLGPLGTTRGELKVALGAIQELDYAPHLEVETYTWEVLPDGGTPNLIDGFTKELVATSSLLASI
jgi:sugar phosphate isomerase/epimerase